MEKRYKIIISNKKIYKEVELPVDATALKIGTTPNCEVRLLKESFFEQFELGLSFSNGTWAITCSNNIYLTADNVRKLVTKELSHGSELHVKYKSSDSELFQLSFMIDFDFEKKDYSRAIDISQCSEITIGGTSNCSIQIDGSLLEGGYAALVKTEGTYTIIDNQTKYGVYVNGRKCCGKTQIGDFDFFSINGYSFYLKFGTLYTSGTSDIVIPTLHTTDYVESKSRFVYPKFNRSTRVKSVIPTEKVPILNPPGEPSKPKGNLIMQLMPALAMLAATVVLRGLMSSSNSSFVLFSAFTMGIGIITSTVGIIDERKKYKKELVDRETKYEAYIQNKKVQIAELRKKEVRNLEDTYYSIGHELNLVRDFSGDLFNRSADDPDFLEVRIGTGSKESNQPVDYKKQEKFEGTDKLAGIPEQIAEEFEKVSSAPITINLFQDSAVGIVGSAERQYDLMKNITVDLCTRQYYSDVKLFYVVGEEHRERYEWVRLLPYVENDVLGIRNIVCDSDSKNILFEYLYKEFSRREVSKTIAPHMVVFVLNDMGIKRHPISKYIKNAKDYGFSFLFFEDHKDLLPSGCNEIISLQKAERAGSLTSSSDSTRVMNFTYETIDDRQAIAVANKLAPVYCEEVSLEGSLTKNITLFELLNIFTAEDLDLKARWSNSEVYRSMAAPLGVKAKNEIVSLDLNEKHHGPHGLVAGTTGSGKSEILQSYILSMATLFHPYEVGFVIIDFKGGGMVNQFKDLPHLVGAITNIDGREINRSLLSIKAELRKRQSLFAQYGVNHIDSYIKLYKKGETPVPLPHLILIVDEFAELKMDQPEFMKELISAARIGRSLGVHLILATQKPSGVVDAQIWSNSRFKLCLKVQNKEDSNEVLKTPLAAEIKEPGRTYLQVGNNEIFDLFQSAYSGAPATADDSASQKKFEIYSVSLWGKRTPVYVKRPDKSKEQSETQLTAIVNYVNQYCRSEHIKRLPGICLPPLSEEIGYSDASATHDGIQTIVPLGIYDDPDNQTQSEVKLNLLSGNTVVIGSSQYGKTNLLQVILRGIADNYTPREVAVYILDFGSMALNVFDGMNHIGGVVVASEDEKLKNLMRMIKGEMKERKETFSKIGITSFSSYKESGENDYPHLIIMVDNFIGLKELYPEYEENLINLCREGVALGISVVMTSLQTSGISYKYMSNFSNRICLYCNQGDEYSNLFDRCRMEPKNVPGRGLVSIDKQIYEYQTFLAFDGEKEIDRVAAIKEYILDRNEKYCGQTARKIPEVPAVLGEEYVNANLKKGQLKPYQVPVGIDYDLVEFVTVDLQKALTIGITGRAEFGKTNIVRVVMRYLQQNVFDYPSKAYIIDDFEKQLSEFSSYGFVEKYSIDANDFELVLNTMEGELQNRMLLMQSGGTEVLRQLPLLLCVVQNNSLFAADGLSKSGVDTLKRILKTYRQMKVCFLFANVENVGIAYGSPELLKMVKDFGMIFVCEDLSNLKLIDVNAATLRQYKKPIELGDCYLITERGIQKQKIIHAKEGR